MNGAFTISRDGPKRKMVRNCLYGDGTEIIFVCLSAKENDSGRGVVSDRNALRQGGGTRIKDCRNLQ